MPLKMKIVIFLSYLFFLMYHGNHKWCDLGQGRLTSRKKIGGPSQGKKIGDPSLGNKLRGLAGEKIERHFFIQKGFGGKKIVSNFSSASPQIINGRSLLCYNIIAWYYFALYFYTTPGLLNCSFFLLHEYEEGEWRHSSQQGQSASCHWTCQILRKFLFS